MKVTLNKTSWHYRFFHLMLPYTTPPKSLCPYFWILVGLVVTSPVILIIHLLEKIRDFFTAKFPKKTKKQKPDKTIEQYEAEWEARRIKSDRRAAFFEKIGGFFGKVFGYVVVPAIGLFGIFYLFYKAATVGWLEVLIVISIILLLIGGIGLIIWLGDMFFEKYSDALVRLIIRFFKFLFKPFRLIGLMIKAVYEKACPLVDWVEPQNTK